MTFFDNYHIARVARTDAMRGVSQAEDSIIARIGNKPVYEPQSNPSHLELSRAINPVERNELEDDERQVQGELAESPSLMGMDLLVAVLFLAEVLGALMVMRALGIQNPERLIYATSLAAFIFFLTGRLSQAQERSRRIWFPILLGIYGALVLGIAAVRMDSATGDEFVSRGFSWGSTIIMVCATVGPAFLFDHVWRERRPVAVLKSKERGLKKRLFQLRRTHRAAQKRVNSIIEAGRTHDERRARMEARYKSTYARHERLNDGSPHAATSTTALVRRQAPPEGNPHHDLR